ncbi:MAG: bifunctional methylenetetrahydrofolate dehydrogenase/methenyltetrahydrofolate cyclohydrolase FolD [bacterium]|nr:bifunctional methylenetetrahydrofolate dehydrogenase/methenyltetrahydrofolate cyclohydrolase FolD [bacterium]
MKATPINGSLVAKLIEADIKKRVQQLKQKVGRAPGLGVILVGDNPASKYYVATKEKVANRAGVQSYESILQKEATFEEVAGVIQKFNKDPNIDGILLQLPVPEHLDSDLLLDLIIPEKDADGLHPMNQGLLMTGKVGSRSCTPLGVMKLIDVAENNFDPESKDANILQLKEADLRGKRAVVVGRSILVGKPVSIMLLERNATVTIAHSKTKDLAAVCKEADILVAAVGVPGLIKGNFIKKGAVVIDVGINRLADGKLVGDVVYEEAAEFARAITPVPGGVGPMTVIMLISNTLKNFERQNGIN